VDHTGSTRCLGALADGPALNLILSSSEVMDELKSTVAAVDDLVDHSWCATLFGSSVTKNLIGGASCGEDLFLVISAEWQDGTATICLDPRHDLWEPLVLLPDVLVTTDVDDIHNGLGTHEQVLVEDINFLVVPGTITDWNLLGEHLLAADQNGLLLDVSLE